MNEQIKQLPEFLLSLKGVLQDHIADHEAKESLISDLQKNVVGRDEMIEEQRVAIEQHLSLIKAHVNTIFTLNAELATTKQQHADEIAKLTHAYQGAVNAVKSESSRLMAHIDKIDPDKSKAKRADLEDRMKRLMEAYRQMHNELKALDILPPDDAP